MNIHCQLPISAQMQASEETVCKACTEVLEKVTPRARQKLEYTAARPLSTARLAKTQTRSSCSPADHTLPIRHLNTSFIS
jgi:hypothetical protein